MFNFTPIARIPLERRARKALDNASRPMETQEKTLQFLLQHGQKTAWGWEKHIYPGMSYPQYAKHVPIADYEAFRPYVMRMIQGESDVLWPGVTRRFAQSSGTTGGKSKYVPVTNDSLRINHYMGAGMAVGLYLLRHPESRMFGGKGFVLGGSFANELDLPAGVKVGDLSAHLIDDINPLVNLCRVPDKRSALMADWSKKLPVLVQESAKCSNITNISGVPSWFLRVLQSVVQKAGAGSIHDVWPGLEVFFHGGISFGPYRDEYAKITTPDKLCYWETYNASEGFFASQSEIDNPGMLLLTNVGVFYEFRPLDGSPVVPLWEVKKGETYDLIISATNGLWRYDLGDTVTVVDTHPVRIVIAGRTKCFINAFGEEVMVHNTDSAITKACHAMNCAMANYTVAPVFSQNGKRGCHQWLIEWDTPPADIEKFAEELDRMLQAENSDYQAKRQGGIFLDRLQVETAPAGLFDEWLGQTGRLGGQRKVPRLSNDRQIMDQLLTLKSKIQ